MSVKAVNKNIFGITQDLKFWLILILIGVIALRLYFIFVYSAVYVVPEKLILMLAFFVMTFIWLFEKVDRNRLFNINTKLLNAQKTIVVEELNTLKTLVYALEAKDAYTQGHCERVTDYADKIASEMNLSESFRKVLKNAASIHDIGKLKIKDAILNKPGKLNDKEWEKLKSHPEEGVKILSVLKFLNKEKRIILHHHEDFNGEGYPDGLKGEEIPLGSRILRIADSFDAMNSARAYREPLSKRDIIRELQAGKGNQFDPEVVDVFLNLIKCNKI